MKRSKSPSGKATTRALMALVSDLHDFEESAERIRIQIKALAERHGITLPRKSRPS